MTRPPRRSRAGAWLPALAGLLVALGGSPAGARQDPGSVEQLLADLKYEEAEEALDALLLTLDGKDRARALLLRARVETDPARARDLYDEVMADWPASAEGDRARLEAARLEFAAGSYADALRLLLEPDRVTRELRDDYAYWTGIAHLALEDFAEAAGVLQTITKGPYLPWSYLALAEADEGLGKTEAALERYRTLSGGKTLPSAEFRLGEVFEELGDRSSASDVFQGLLATFPKSPEAALAREKVRTLALQRVLAEGGEPPGDQEGNAARSGDGPLFAVQVGAFLDRSNALRLRTELASEFERVVVLTEVEGGRALHRVRVGRFRSREEAERVASRIERTFEIRPHIVTIDQPHD